MDKCPAKLIEIAGTAICSSEPVTAGAADSPRLDELYAILRVKNGFYAFESALHVFPACKHASATHTGLAAWNAMSTWKAEFGTLLDSQFCFAEDIFGEQFIIAGDEIVRFNPESGEFTFIATTVDDWCCQLLSDYENLTGYPFAHRWQQSFGRLADGDRLAPKIPFILGGEYDVNNLFAMDSARAMRLRADIYRQTRDLPDGTRVRFSTQVPMKRDHNTSKHTKR